MNRAAIVDTPGQPMRVEQVEVLPPRRGEVLVRLAAAGVCRGDLHYISGHFAGPLPFIPSHEGAGVVDAVGPSVETVAALMGCAVVTGLGAVFHAARPSVGESVLVVGAGGVSLNVVEAAHLVGAEPIIAADVAPQKLEWARQRGATHTLDGRETGWVESVRGLTHGRGVDFAYEVVGRLETLQAAYAAVRRGGACLLVGAVEPGVTWALSPIDLLRDEKTVRASRHRSANFRRTIPA